MWQDICWPEQTRCGLSLAFIRRGEKEEKRGRKRQHQEKRQKKERARRVRRGAGSEKKTESMPSVKQEGLCSLKLV